MGEVSEDSWQWAPHSGTDCTKPDLSWDTSHPPTVCLPSTLWYRGLANRSPGAQREYWLSSLKEVHICTLLTCKTLSLWHRSKCIYCSMKSIASLSTNYCAVCRVCRWGTICVQPKMWGRVDHTCQQMWKHPCMKTTTVVEPELCVHPF